MADNTTAQLLEASLLPQLKLPRRKRRVYVHCLVKIAQYPPTTKDIPALRALGEELADRTRTARANAQRGTGSSTDNLTKLMLAARTATPETLSYIAALGARSDKLKQGFYTEEMKQEVAALEEWFADNVGGAANDDKLASIAAQCEANGDFDASSEADARKFQMRAIAYRQGQPRFRDELIKAYEGKCAVTECSVLEVLEAAHIKPFCEDQNTTYHVGNGILLRSDIHTLFDQYLMGINPDDFTLTFAESVMLGKYKGLNEQLRRPADDRSKPLQDLLRERWNEFLKRNGTSTI
jgi:hypothetical protein